MQKRLTQVLLVILFLVIVGASTLFLFRNSILNNLIANKVNAFKEKYNGELLYKKAAFKGLNEIVIENVSLYSPNKDTVLTVDSTSLKVNLFSLLKGKVRFSNLLVSNILVNLRKNDSLDNFSFLLKHKSTRKTTHTSGYSVVVENIFSFVFDAISANINLKNIAVIAQIDSSYIKTNIPQLAVKDRQLKAQFFVEELGIVNVWNFYGVIDKAKRMADINLVSASKQSSTIPYIKSRYGLVLRFDTLQFSIGENNYNDKQHLFELTGNAKIKNLTINHWRLSPQDVGINNGGIQYKINVGNDYIELDSASSVQLNQLEFNSFLQYKRVPSKIITCHIKMPETSSQVFFNSLPTGVFRSFADIKTTGTLNYQLRFLIDTQMPDSLMFESALMKHDFKILKYGATNFTKLNDEFMYDAYDKDKLIRSFSVGPSNPHFTSYANISNYLKNAILVSEDGTFFYHKGFNERAFRRSIATNYKEKRFARGGSTISMQLVKNVFLTRNKTISRKLEEALIVWLIENNRISSKERMYEVYLNIIEWGPNIYGIGEASKFYFNKTPADLNLPESIFMASIIPKPKFFKYYFSPDGKLKDFLDSHYKLIASNLVKKEIITEAEQEALLPDIKLNGDAKNFLPKIDSTILLLPETLNEDGE